MRNLRDDFDPKAPVSQVPASWFNRVAKFINNLVPGDNCSFEKCDDGTPTVIDCEAGGETKPSAPSSTTNLRYSSGSSAVTTSYSTPGEGGKGLAVQMWTRTTWDGSVLYGFYRTLTFNEYGRLVSVSGETRTTVDSPVTYNTQ